MASREWWVTAYRNPFPRPSRKAIQADTDIMAQQNLDRAMRDLHYHIVELSGLNELQKRQIREQESSLQHLRTEKDGLLHYSHHVLNGVIEKETQHARLLSENSDLRRRIAELEHTVKSVYNYALADDTTFAQRMVHTLGPFADRAELSEDARKRQEAAMQLAELQASTPVAKSLQQPSVEELWAHAIGENPRVEEGALAWAERRNRNPMPGSEATEKTNTGDRQAYPGGGYCTVTPQPGSSDRVTKSWDEANVMESVETGYDPSWQGAQTANEMTQELSMSISDFSSTPSV